VRHFASAEFWRAYARPSLHFKQIGRYWSVRVGARHRALGVDVEEGVLWFWIGSHADYDRLLR
jgi:hypothetical protein